MLATAIAETAPSPEAQPHTTACARGALVHEGSDVKNRHATHISNHPMKQDPKKPYAFSKTLADRKQRRILEF